MTNTALKLDTSTEREVQRICDHICQITGVQLGEKQFSMVMSRLQRRCVDLELSDINAYIQHFHANKASETDALVSLLTTHHTYFFRESSHFRFIESTGLAHVVAAAKKRNSKTIRILSAACSRGHECYSLSMFMAHHLPKIAPDFNWEIVGTDIDPESIAIANNGVYHRNETKSIPMQYLGNHWARGTGEISEYVKAKSTIKEHCKFTVDNLLTPKPGLSAEKFDFIFCRNVFIYFTTEQIKAITANLLQKLQPSGFLFVGISESLTQVGLGLKSRGPSIYSTQDNAVSVTALPSAPSAKLPPHNSSTISGPPVSSAPPMAATQELLRVMCVDDSPVILTILKKILTEDKGFKIVATAKNGLEAAKCLATNQIDVMTLDIHMPEEDGLTYLKKNFSKQHPAVVMLSSVSREDTDLAINCLNAGASDYVEKPAMGNIEERGEEIRLKLRCALTAKLDGAMPIKALDNEFSKKTTILSTDNMLRIMLANLSDRKKVLASIAEINGNQPPTILILEGSGNPVESVAKDLSSRSRKSFNIYSDGDKTLKDNSFYICDATSLDNLLLKFGTKTASILVYGEATPASIGKLTSFRTRNILAEEQSKPRTDKHVRNAANDLVPATSFIFMSNHFFAQRGK